MGDRVLFANGDRPATLAAIGAAKADTKWSAIHNGYDTPILYQGYLYSTSGYGARDFQCYDAKDGSLKWKTSYKDRHNYNPTFMILADGKLIVQHLHGLVEVVKPSPESCQSLGTYDIRGKKPEHFADSSWQTPALSRGRLYCRMDFGDVVALDIRVDRPAPSAPPPIPDGYVQKLPRADQNMAGPVASEDKQGGLGEEIRVARVDEKNAPVPPFQKPGPSDYFQGRGPNRDRIVQGSKLPLDWRQGQPRELWRVDIGMGYSSPVVAGDRLYIMGWYDDATWAGAARGSFNRCCHNFIGCLDVRTGRTIWKCAYLPQAVRLDHGCGSPGTSRAHLHGTAGHAGLGGRSAVRPGPGRRGLLPGRRQRKGGVAEGPDAGAGAGCPARVVLQRLAAGSGQRRGVRGGHGRDRLGQGIGEGRLVHGAGSLRKCLAAAL